MKNAMSIFFMVLMMVTFTGCNAGENGLAKQDSTIVMISREDGSGTRGAFVDLFDVTEVNTKGNKIDGIHINAEITNSTAIMMAKIQGNENAIGYISLGALNDTVKALSIDDVAATAENIKNGSYTVSRSFNLVMKEKVKEITQDFLAYILSTQGQAVIAKKGYIPLKDSAPYSGNRPEGKLVIAGSSSVSPVMEALKEAYLKMNPRATIDIHQSDSTTGVTSTVEGICDIGMVSRELKESERKKGISQTTIAKDGIVVIVNPGSTVDNLTKDQVKQIYAGQITSWSEIE